MDCLLSNHVQIPEHLFKSFLDELGNLEFDVIIDRIRGFP
jgi:hypothetical protein